MHGLAFRAAEFGRHFHDIDVMVVGDEVQEESAEGDLGHPDLALEGYRANELSASAAARNIDPWGEEFDRHFGPLCEWLRFRSETPPWPCYRPCGADGNKRELGACSLSLTHSGDLPDRLWKRPTTDGPRSEARRDCRVGMVTR
jgi:hypothetical protein